jgi:uncharacterized membrane protein
MADFHTTDSSVTLRNWSFAIYVLYLLGAVTGFTAIIGVIMAHIKVSEADSLWRSHFVFQIRTFWLSVLAAIVGVVMCFTLILLPVGILLLSVLGFWVVVRSIVGLIKTSHGQPIPAPQSLLLGL